MVNAPPTNRRQRDRADTGAVVGGGVLGQAKLNPFGDLHTVQHVSARFAKALRTVFEPLLGQEVRAWAEPLVVQRFADYRTERGDALTAWLPLRMTGGVALVALDGRFVLRTLDLFFGGTGASPPTLPAEFSGSAEALVARIGDAIAGPLAAAWEPLTPMTFAPAHVEIAAQGLADGDDAMIVTRFGIAAGSDAPAFVDIIYPVAALKPFTASLTGKVLDKVEPDAAWRHQLLRATMAVRFPVRSVLAEPVVPLSMLMSLQIGDVIPISFGPNVPVMVGRDCLGAGTVGTSNGQAAIRLTHLARPDEGSDQ